MKRLGKKIAVACPTNPQFLEAALAIVLFTIAALPYYQQIPNDLIGYPDEYKHLLIARSLSTTGGLDQQTLTGIQYPPGWGTVIYILSILFDNQLTAAHLLNTVLAWLTGPLVYLYLRKRTKPLLALAIGGFASVHVLTIMLGDSVLSEPIFGVAWLISLIWMHRSMESGWPAWFLAGGMIALCMSFRTIGISLWIGAVFYLGLNSKNNFSTKLLYIVCLSIIPIIYLALLNSFHPMGGVNTDSGYGHDFLSFELTESSELLSGIVMRTVSDAVQHTRDLTKSVIPIKVFRGSGLSRLILYAAAIGLVISAFMGWVRKIWHAATPLEYAIACYIGILYMWPFTKALRLFWPVVPLVVYYAITNIIELKFWQQRLVFIRPQVVISAIIIVTMISFVKNISITSSRRAQIAANQVVFKEALNEAIKLSPDPVIATLAFPQIEYWFPKIKTCRLILTIEREAHQSRINQCHANFLFSKSRFQHNYLFKSLLAGGNSKYQLVFQKANVYLWRIQN